MMVREVDEATARALRARVHSEARALLPLIEGLYRAGLIVGWRRVLAVSVSERNERKETR